MRLIGYVRVSTQGQAEEGVSLEAQESDIKSYCAIYKHQLVDLVRDEGYSGSTLERPGIQQVLKAIRAKQADGLIVVKLDRLSRNVRDLGSLSEEEICLVSVQEQIDTSTATGRLIFHMIGAISQWERETIGERIKRAIAHLKENNLHFGELPYGLDLSDQKDAKGRTLTIENPEEMGVIRLMLSLRTGENPLSYEKIAQYLNQHGIPTKRGQRWFRYGVWRIVQRCKTTEEQPC